ncbi:type I restriction enzyme HsdR N-terminal domain-containing protein [Bacillus cereus]|uniref:type I restriction enzyme HsdR N-terminal domain-containing protein n=1 Tax=Bacillus cereus TaxID=1396 RepID=UPI000BF3315A|nr:type I restriction enzyme HsdR N-terminal domain-containing protein [Bacillus cereus]PFT28958.1 hypothetical protein COK71_25180 [Bacillus cereus]
MKKKYMNEEQVKNTVIVPYFKKMGFLTDEIEFETHFKINIPRQGKIHIGEEIIKNVYSDILYKTLINGELRNIILVEVKRENHTIEQKDIEQAINYARLLDEIAPYSVVTNGRNTRIFDTITKLELTNTDLSKSSFIVSGYNLTISENIREIALKTFIGLDRKNLLNFCQLQSERNFNDIRSKTISNKSIIDGIHCNRNKYMSEFKNFMNSKSKIYAVIGNSGVGKTNYLYSLWESYKDHFPILFYSAGLLNQRLINAIHEDFQFLLNQEYSISELIRRFDDITKRHEDQRFYIIIDGLDEHPNNIELRNELNDLIKKIQDSNIFLIVSCKTTNEINDIWYKFTHYKGALNSLGDNIYMPKNLSYRNKLGIYIDKLDDQELIYIWKKYKKTYEIEGDLDNESRELAKEPFLMRMIAELYQGKEVVNQITEIELYHKWLHRKLGETSKPEMSKLIFKKIINHMVELKSETIEQDYFMELLSMVDNGYLYFQELLNIGLIAITKDSNQIQYISICNSTLMKYTYCYEIEKWQTKRMVDLIYSFNTHIKEEFLRQFPIFLITFKQQNLFKDENKIWNESYINNDQPVCFCCNNTIQIQDKITIVLRVDKNNILEEILGDFNIVHEKCAWNGPSMLDLRTEIQHAILNVKDFLDLHKIFSLLKFMTDDHKLKLERNIEKENLKSSPNYEFLPLIVSKGEPFWTIMEFYDEVNTGNMKSLKINTKDYLLFFDSKEKAEFYLNSNQKAENSKTIERVVGIEKKYIKRMEDIYKKSNVNMPSVAVAIGFKDGGEALVIQLEFKEVINVVNSGLSFLQYIKQIRGKRKFKY